MSRQQRLDALRILDEVFGWEGGAVPRGDDLRGQPVGGFQGAARSQEIPESALEPTSPFRKVVSPERAARFAKILGRSQQQFVRLALQELVNEAGLKMKVDVAAA